MLSKGKFLTQEMQAVPAGWSASALTHFIPRREGEEATSTVVSRLHGQGSRLLNLHHPAGGFSWKGTSLNL